MVAVVATEVVVFNEEGGIHRIFRCCLAQESLCLVERNNDPESFLVASCQFFAQDSALTIPTIVFAVVGNGVVIDGDFLFIAGIAQFFVPLDGKLHG